ncbi:hypothetical protein EV401DRAFT_46156 [Pisolithus croceorrhizus]|nr:hypothetical protein EV401DRAFT_46156 [Pisolithus croceorrhizus]
MGSHIPLFRVSYPPYALVLALCYAFMQLTFLQHSMFCYALVVSSLSRVDTRMIIKVSSEDVAPSVDDPSLPRMISLTLQRLLFTSSITSQARQHFTSTKDKHPAGVNWR